MNFATVQVDNNYTGPPNRFVYCKYVLIENPRVFESYYTIT